VISLLITDSRSENRQLQVAKTARLVSIVSAIAATFLFTLLFVLLLDLAKANDVQFDYNYITHFSFFSLQPMYEIIVEIFCLAISFGFLAICALVCGHYHLIGAALKGEKWYKFSRASLIALFSTELFLLFESVGLNRLNYFNIQSGQYSQLALALLVPLLALLFLTSFRFLGNQNPIEYIYSRTYDPHPPQNEPIATGFSPQLSGLRGLAALGVAVLHTIVFLNIVTPLAYFTNTLFVGVPLFFMLSISLLLSNLQKNYDLKRYFMRRIVRIWPIYFGCLVVFYLYFRMPLNQFISFAFFVQYFTSPGGGIKVASSFWTLQLEEFAYIFIPLIALLNRSQKRYLAALMIAIGASSFALFYSPSISTGENQIHIIQSCLLPYGLGLLAFSTKMDRRLRLLVPIGLALLTIQNAGLLTSLVPLTLLGYFLTLAGFAACLRYPPKFLGYLTFLGESSYALYAIHVTFILTFGVLGLFLAIPSAFAIEFLIRHKEIIKRLKIAYSIKSYDMESTELIIPSAITRRQTLD
jgi:peptidoglycan/LPS O-acetylase OafA/YrhL